MPTMTVDIAELAEITGENARLKMRVDELLESNTRPVEERRAIDRRAMVRAFHRAGEHPVLETPQVPGEDRARLRIGLVIEEFLEMLEAVVPGVGGDPIGRMDDYDSARVDLPALVDAWADLIYVIDGAALEFGIDLDAVFRGVHEANMRKFGPGSHKREDGKTLKPPDWEPFDVAAELRRQGWRP